MVGNDESLRQQWFTFMQGFFEVSDDCDLRWYLGVNYVRQGGDLIATQTAYLDRVLERYGMTNCKPA
eukprot:3406538-Rhodomonas_salina.1